MYEVFRKTIEYIKALPRRTSQSRRALKLRSRTILIEAGNQIGMRETRSNTLKEAPKETKYACPACQEEMPASKSLLKRPCGHRWCKDCLQRLVEHSTTNESYFPPRCCGRRIPLGFLSGIISPDLVQRYRERNLERDASRTYCSSPLCSIYIPVENIRSHIGTCKACGKKTCTRCKRKGHKLECNRDNVWRLIRKKGWRQCGGCRNVVERVGGCSADVGIHFAMSVVRRNADVVKGEERQLPRIPFESGVNKERWMDGSKYRNGYGPVES
ncbi:hypothetical protein N7448_005274 [Penicillium atrosanguineum]|uniref:Argininosuccinate synthase n=1 Tax=Penicillium atrosanguineum TaxID=1132637 RepID=UPI0023848E0D|nr:Argininosuccinate synthase [Penicillium atrosanguineum]KAJ5125963.1 hypothetical protein N7526_008140 [Penicillium atrosanguineum]KAJ5136720.1 hypothetical protein N7448_005274 [Penicillium atrosanguineum]KAJ5293051.1 Argininosuccinate synthase [Penicillium atrosanguineum]